MSPRRPGRPGVLGALVLVGVDAWLWGTGGPFDFVLTLARVAGLFH